MTICGYCRLELPVEQLREHIATHGTLVEYAERKR